MSANNFESQIDFGKDRNWLLQFWKNFMNKVVGHDHAGDGNGAPISYNNLTDKPTSIANAANVTTSINGIALDEIFATDNTTVKRATRATYADSVDELAGTTGGKWVEVVSGSISVAAESRKSIPLLPTNQHNFYLYSVYSSDSYTPVFSFEQAVSGSLNCAYIAHESPDEDYDKLWIYNEGTSSKTFNYKVLAWQ